MSAAAGIVVLAGRILFAVFFGWVAGRAHIRMSPMFEGGARAGGFPVPAMPAGGAVRGAAAPLEFGRREPQPATVSSTVGDAPTDGVTTEERIDG